MEAWYEEGRSKKTIVFCASVKHAHTLCNDFNQLGFIAEVIDGQSKDREEILEKFKKRIQILLNYNVLTEGYDEPTIECILLARPTTSPLVYNQCLGRGLRPEPCKKSCLVIDIVDRSTHQLQYSANQLNGLPDNWRCSSDPFQARKYLSKIKVNDPAAFIKINKSENLREVQSILMELPPETVLAGLDGKPVPRYEMANKSISKDNAHITAEKILNDLERNFERITYNFADLKVHFQDLNQANKKYSFAKWHLKQATGLNVIFCETRKQSNKNHKQILKNQLVLRQLSFSRLIS
ncbi:MAG: DEAD/DEAH box helicase [Oligoflexales bacterium]